MIANRFSAMTVTFVVAITGTVNADGEDTPAQAAPVEVFPLPANTTFERHVIGEGGTTTATGERLIYSNTLGTFGAAPGTNKLFADDITTTVPGGCQLVRYEFPVVGKVNPAGIGEQYTVDFAMYSSCPQSVPLASRPGLIIPGTQGQVTFTDQCQNAIDNDSDTVVNDGCPAVGPAETGSQCQNAIDDDGDTKVNDGCPAVDDPETDQVESVPRLISFVPAIDVPLPTNFWFGVKFSRNNAGVMVGTPPMTGFSCDQWDFPGFPCQADAGGFPDQPQASFSLEIFADSACDNSYTGYKNDLPHPTGFLYNPGSDVFLADDIQLSASGCNMIAYEVAIRGQGFYNFRMQQECESGIIAGTERTWPQPASLDVKIVRYTFDPPIALPENISFQAKVNNTTSGVVIAGQQACIGETGDLLYTIVNNTCTEVPPYDLGPGIHGAFNLAITCAGVAPVGACCDMYITDENNDAVCREVPKTNCPFPQRFSLDRPVWVQGEACEPDPFSPHPCGVAACCRPDQVCENLTQNECNAVPPLDEPRQWRRGRYCGVDGQICPWMACVSRVGDCLTAHEEPGCNYPECCVAVCDADSYCCLVEWDRICVERANTLCPDVRGHDECSSLYPSISALPVEADSVTVFSNVGATQNLLDPRFCCRNDAPGAQALGTAWFKFTATDTSARVSTCGSDPARDSLIDVFAVADPTTEETACASLIPIACSDDVEDCGGGTHGRVCVQGLMPGQTYYVMVASKSAEQQGLYQLEIRSPCFEEPIWNPNDCNNNKLPDGCDLGNGTSRDCNDNKTPDECDIAGTTSRDCNDNGVPDSCDIATGASLDCQLNGVPDQCEQDCNQTNVPDDCDLADGTSRDCQPNGVPDECDVASGTSPDCNSDFLPDECTTHRQTLRPDPPSMSFGRTLAIEGDLLLVGDPEPSDTSGAAYVYRRMGSFWIQEAKLTSPEALPGSFGWSVALGDGRAYIVGGTGANQEGDIPGAVFLFTYDGTTWRHQSTLTVNDPSEAKRRLCGVAAHGNHIAVSACWTGISIPESSPAAIIYVFRRDGSGLIQEAKLFGHAVSLHRDRIAIGMPYDDTDYVYAVGSVSIYRRIGSQWVFETRLTWPEVNEYGYFGDSLELRGDWLVVGRRDGSSCVQQAPCHEAALFRHKGDAWSYDGRVADQAGWHWPGTVGFVREGMVVTGAAGGADGATLAYVYQRQATGQWTRIAFLKATDGVPKNFFATGVLGAGDSAIISILPVDSQTGDPPVTISVFAVAASDCNKNGFADYCDLRDGTSPDCNRSGVPDDCETLPPFDYDFDTDVDLIDLAGFQRCFTGTGPAKLAPCCTVFHSEPDGDVDLADFVAFGGVFSGPKTAE